MASKEGTTTDRGSDELPFGTIQGEEGRKAGSRPKARPSRRKSSRSKRSSEESGSDTGKSSDGEAGKGERGQDGGHEGKRPSRGRRKRRRGRGGRDPQASGGSENRDDSERKPKKRGGRSQGGGPDKKAERFDSRVETGMFVMEKGDYGALRREGAEYRQSKEDIFVPKHLITKFQLSEGSLVTGRTSRGQKHKYQLVDIQEVDGKPPEHWKHLTAFKDLTSIDPDFHYAVGDVTDDVSMRIVDLLCPIGRGQRGLIVAPPRSGKTTILRQFAKGIEDGYPDVHLMVLLIDERPEEATEWRRSVTTGKVFVSTADETSKIHIQTAEAVWKRACRMVEMGEDVVVLLDSITRLARAYNNQASSGRTMSGGLDSRAMERPRKIFGSARNTVEAGSLTILGTTLVETGSRMDQLVYEEFKGTGNMEMVLNRKLADRRIFPAIDVEKAGTRKEEKLFGMRRLKLVHTLRRVLLRMNFIEAMELLITRLSEVDKTDDFLKRFEVDPEA